MTERARLLVPDADLQQWDRWAEFHGGMPLRFSSPEHLPPGLRPLCEPEGFTYKPGPGDGLASAGKTMRVDVDGALSSVRFGSVDGAVAFSVDFAGRAAHHARLFLPKAANRFGLGRTYVQRAALLYLALGVRHVSIRAEQIGKYAWSTVGFSFIDGPTRMKVVSAVQEFAAELDVFDADIPEFKHPWELAEMFTDDNGVELEVPQSRLNEVVDERYRGLQDIPADLPASKALLLYADYEWWDGFVRLDWDDPGFRRLWTGKIQ